MREFPPSKPPVQPDSTDEERRQFLEQGCYFNCPKLSARITRGSCIDRQTRAVEEYRAGQRIKFYNTPLDQYCRSGKCKLGKSIFKLEAARTRQEEQRAAATAHGDAPLRDQQSTERVRARNRKHPATSKIRR